MADSFTARTTCIRRKKEVCITEADDQRILNTTYVVEINGERHVSYLQARQD